MDANSIVCGLARLALALACSPINMVPRSPRVRNRWPVKENRTVVIRVSLVIRSSYGWGSQLGTRQSAPTPTPDRSVMLAVVSRRSNRGCQPDTVRRLLGVEDRGSSPKLFCGTILVSVLYIYIIMCKCTKKKKESI